MNRSGVLLILILVVAEGRAAPPTTFANVRLADDGTTLQVSRANGSAFAAPKFDDQDRFDKPAISADGRYVGWLALYPNRGASYSQPLELVIFDAKKRDHHFAGTFGMVVDWCFAGDSRAVVYKYSLPHGRTATGFDLRRLSDGRLLRRTVDDPMGRTAESQEAELVAPAWAACLLVARPR